MTTSSNEQFSIPPKYYDLSMPNSYNHHNHEILRNIYFSRSKIMTIFGEPLSEEPFSATDRLINVMDNINFKYMSKKYSEYLCAALWTFTNRETLNQDQTDVLEKYYIPLFYDSLYGFGFEFKYDDYGYLKVDDVDKQAFNDYYKKFYGQKFKYLPFEEITQLHMKGWANKVIKSNPEYQMFVNLLIMDDKKGNDLLKKLNRIHFKLNTHLKNRLPTKLGRAMAKAKSNSVKTNLDNLQKSLAEGVEPDAASNRRAHLYPLGGGGRKSKRNITRKNKKNARKNNKKTQK